MGNYMKCPVCSKPTNCAIELGKSYSTCWCMNAVPAARAIDVMNEYPGQCLCVDCLTQNHNSKLNMLLNVRQRN